MISPAQAFRVWHRLFTMRGYPVPNKRAVIVLFAAWLLVPIGLGLSNAIASGDLARTSFSDFIPTGVDWGALRLFAGFVAWYLFGAYVLAVMTYWQDIGRDQWLNEGRMCRTCTHEGPRPRVASGDSVTRFNLIRKDYDRARKARRRAQRAEQGSPS